MKKLVSILFVICMSFLMVACGAPAGTSTPPAADVPSTAPSEAGPSEPVADAEPFVAGFDMASNQVPYMVKFADYLQQFCDEEGIELILVQSDADIAKQITAAENMLVQGAQVISGVYMDPAGGMPIVEACREKDVALIASLTSLADDGGGYENYIYLGSENYDGGYLQGLWMAENLPEGTEVLYMGTTPTEIQGMDRRAGMEAALKDEGRDDISIVATEYTNAMMDAGVTVMETWLQAYDSIDCVVGSADASVLGAIEAAKTANRMDETVFIGFDGQDLALESIKAGEMAMTVFQDARAQARALTDMYMQIRDGADPSQMEDALIPFQSITIDNVSDFE